MSTVLIKKWLKQRRKPLFQQASLDTITLEHWSIVTLTLTEEQKKLLALDTITLEAVSHWNMKTKVISIDPCFNVIVPRQGQES